MKCETGLVCLVKTATNFVPGCNGTLVPSGTGDGIARENWGYCASVEDFVDVFTPYSTGSDTASWHLSDKVLVNLVAGSNSIKLSMPGTNRYSAGIDYLRVEGLPLASSASFRNPPHFVNMAIDIDSDELGEVNLRDAEHETEAVLDYYFRHNNLAPFLCIRMIQRFGFSNPSKRFVKNCVDSFRSGSYSSGNHTFGNAKYGSLEAMVAAIVLDREATDPSARVDPSAGSVREPVLKVMNVLRSLEYQGTPPALEDGSLLQSTYSTRMRNLQAKIGQFFGMLIRLITVQLLKHALL